MRAPTASAASCRPSRTRCGAYQSSAASLLLAGSPSAPLATATGLPPAVRHCGQLRRDREGGAAAAGQPGLLDLLNQGSAAEPRAAVPAVMVDQVKAGLERHRRGGGGRGRSGTEQPRQARVARHGAVTGGRLGHRERAGRSHRTPAPVRARPSSARAARSARLGATAALATRQPAAPTHGRRAEHGQREQAAGTQVVA